MRSPSASSAWGTCRPGSAELTVGWGCCVAPDDALLSSAPSNSLPASLRPEEKVKAVTAHQTDSRLSPRHARFRWMPAATRTRTLTAWLPGSQPPHTRASTSADCKSAILDAVHDAAKGMHKAGVTDLVTLPQLRPWNC